MGWIKSLIAAGNNWAALPGYGSGGYGEFAYTNPQYGRSNTGLIVSRETAMKLSSWYGAHRILSEQFAIASLKLYKRTKNGGKEVVTDEPLARIFSRRPNQWQDAFTFKNHVFGHKFWNGNAYFFKLYSDANILVGLVPLNPARVQPILSEDGSLWYIYTNEKNEKKPYSADQILHWRGPTLDGVLGVSLISYAADNIGIATKRQQHQEHLLENGAKPSGVYSVPGKLSQDEFKALLAKIKKQNTGPQNAGNVIVLDNGSKFEKTSMSNQDMQHVEDARMDISHTGRFTGVPPLLLFENEKSTFNNMLEAGKHFLRYGLNPHLVSFEVLVNDGLIAENKKEKYFFEFDRSDYEKMDLDKTAEWVKTMRYAGCISANEGRSVFNLSPREDQNADDLLRPENMAPAGADYGDQGQPAPSETPQPEPPKDKKKPDEKVKNSLENAFLDVFSDIFERISNKTTLKFEALKKKHSGEALQSEMAAFFRDQRDVYSSWMRPAVLGAFKAAGEYSPSAEMAADRVLSAAIDSVIDKALSALAEETFSTAALNQSEIVSTIFQKVEAHYEA